MRGERPRRSVRKGVVCILLSAFGFALMAMFVRLADVCGSACLPAVQKAFFRNLVAAAIAGAAFLAQRRARRTGAAGGCASVPLTWRVWLDLLLRAAFGTCGIVANFYALSHIPIGDAMALNKTAPFFTLLLSWLLLGERMTARQAFCVAGAFGGAMLVVKPGFAGLFSVAALVGLASGVCAGSAYAFLHRLGRAGVDGAFIVLFFSVFSCLACVPWLVSGAVPMSGWQVAVLFAAGGGAALGQFGITWAYRFSEPRQIAVYDYAGIVFAAILGFAAFGQTPDATSLVGMLVIIGMGVALHLRFPRRLRAGL